MPEKPNSNTSETTDPKMARLSDKDRVAADQKQINASNKRYEEWETAYDCERLEQCLYGHQYEDTGVSPEQRKYIINLFHSGLNISKPSMLFMFPKFRVMPRPMRSDDVMSEVAMRAKLQEELLNAEVTDPDLNFIEEIDLAVIDSHIRFGVVEVGYTSDYIDNPLAGKPVLKDGEPMVGSDGAPAVEPDYKLNREDLFVKWIPAKQCRVSIREKNNVKACDWFAYFEWHYIDDVVANPNYKNTSGLKASARAKMPNDDARPETAKDEAERKPGMVKVWKKWDFRKKEKRIFVDGGEKYLREEPFTFFPCAVLNFHRQLNSFYPVPVFYNWLSAQYELNEDRQMRRCHKRRAIRRYLRTNRIAQEEFDKLADAEDFTAINVDGTTAEGALVPVPDAPLDPAIFKDAALALEDFTRVSNISGETQQVAQSETATQANLIALAGKIAERAKSARVGLWLSEIGRIMLMTIREKMALPRWIQKAVDPYSPMAMMEAQEVALLWKQITQEEIGAIDNDISVDFSSMSPMTQAQERDQWLGFLGILTNSPVGMVLSMSPALLRKTAALFDITSEREIAEVGRAMTMMAQMQATAAAQKSSGAGEAGKAAPGPTPDNNAISAQLNQQLPVEMGSIQ